MQSREEGVALAVQLAECKECMRQAENSADDAHDESRALREQLEEAESQMQQMQQRLVDTAANCRRFVNTALHPIKRYTIVSYCCQSILKWMHLPALCIASKGLSRSCLSVMRKQVANT